MKRTKQKKHSSPRPLGAILVLGAQTSEERAKLARYRSRLSEFRKNHFGSRVPYGTFTDLLGRTLTKLSVDQGTFRHSLMMQRTNPHHSLLNRIALDIRQQLTAGPHPRIATKSPECGRNPRLFADNSRRRKARSGSVYIVNSGQTREPGSHRSN